MSSEKMKKDLQSFHDHPFIKERHEIKSPAGQVPSNMLQNSESILAIHEHSYKKIPISNRKFVSMNLKSNKPPTFEFSEKYDQLFGLSLSVIIDKIRVKSKHIDTTEICYSDMPLLQMIKKIRILNDGTEFSTITTGTNAINVNLFDKTKKREMAKYMVGKRKHLTKFSTEIPNDILSFPILHSLFEDEKSKYSSYPLHFNNNIRIIIELRPYKEIIRMRILNSKGKWKEVDFNDKDEEYFSRITFGSDTKIDKNSIPEFQISADVSVIEDIEKKTIRENKRYIIWYEDIVKIKQFNNAKTELTIESLPKGLFTHLIWSCKNVTSKQFNNHLNYRSDINGTNFLSSIESVKFDSETFNSTSVQIYNNFPSEPFYNEIYGGIALTSDGPEDFMKAAIPIEGKKLQIKLGTLDENCNYHVKVYGRVIKKIIFDQAENGEYIVKVESSM